MTLAVVPSTVVALPASLSTRWASLPAGKAIVEIPARVVVDIEVVTAEGPAPVVTL